MSLIEWLKWRVAPSEMEELERWRIQWHEHRRWFAEFPVAAVTLDRLKAKADGEPVTSIHVARDSCRSSGVEQVCVSRKVIERTLHCLNTPHRSDLRLVLRDLYAAIAKGVGRHVPATLGSIQPAMKPACKTLGQMETKSTAMQRQTAQTIFQRMQSHLRR